MAQGIYSEHIKMSKGIQGSYFTMPIYAEAMRKKDDTSE
ncbi:conserved hypothetical protein [Trichinella spiralis]|nr:conserved hypothetical protein [Trichinella spiralis]